MTTRSWAHYAWTREHLILHATERQDRSTNDCEKCWTVGSLVNIANTCWISKLNRVAFLGLHLIVFSWRNSENFSYLVNIHFAQFFQAALCFRYSSRHFLSTRILEVEALRNSVYFDDLARKWLIISCAQKLSELSVKFVLEAQFFPLNRDHLFVQILYDLNTFRFFKASCCYQCSFFFFRCKIFKWPPWSKLDL